MTEHVPMYAVYFHANALEALGDPIKPFLTQGANGPHLLCTEIDTGGSFAELMVDGRNAEGKKIETEVMVPVGMIRLIISLSHEDGVFGFAVD
jgi:hypothetical protein